MSVPDLLRGCPLFFELYDREIAKIVNHCTVVTVQDGDKVFEDGAEGSEIYIVLTGRAKVVKQMGSHQIEVQTLLPGDIFGEMVILDEPHRNSDVVAVGETCILEIRYEDFFVVFKKEPKIFGLMVLNLARMIARRLSSSNDVIIKLQSFMTGAKDDAEREIA